MDTQDVRTGSSAADTSLDAENAQRVYGRNWPFPLTDPVPWTAKQIKAAKAKEISEYEQALL